MFYPNFDKLLHNPLKIVLMLSILNNEKCIVQMLYKHCISAQHTQIRLGLQCQTSLRSYPGSLIPYLPAILGPLTISLPLVPYPQVMFLSRNLGWGFLSSLLLSLLLMLLLSQAKVKSTPSNRPKTRLEFNNIVLHI